MLRFKFDENMPDEVAELFRNAGHDAAMVLDQRLGGQPDPNIAKVCQDEDRVLVTLPYSCLSTDVLSWHHRAASDASSKEEVENNLWIVDETSVRMRRKPPPSPVPVCRRLYIL